MTEIEQAGRSIPGAAVAATRLRPPRLYTRPVDRLRLRRSLDRDSWEVAVVAARAAAGKTTLVAAWAARLQEPVAWLTCDRAERDGPRLVASLTAAVQAAVPDFGTAVGVERNGDASGRGSDEGVTIELCKRLSELAHPLAIVVDDYHLLDPATARPVLDAIVDATHHHVRLVLVGRGRPPLRIARLQMQHRAISIDDDDLVLDDDEAAEMLRSSLELELDDLDVRAVHRRCEGWAGGICLVATALRRHNGDVTRVLARIDAPGSDVGDLLIDEVLDGMDDDNVDFLLRVSLLEELSPALCAAVSGRADAGRRLAELHRSIGFVVAVDDEQAPYRLHAVFRDVLRDRADAVLQDEVVDVHRRAAAWLEAKGFDGEAIDHLLAAGNISRATAAIRRARTQPRWLADVHRQLRWLDALPDEVVANHGDLVAGRMLCRFLVHGELPVATIEPASASEAALAFVAAAMVADLAAEQRFAALGNELAARSDPNMVPYNRALLASVALALDQLDEAQLLLQRAVAADVPAEIGKAMINTYLAIVADQRGDDAEVQSAATRAVAARPPEHRRFTDSQQIAAALLAEQRGDTGAALASLRCFVAADPSVAWPRFKFAAWLRIAQLEAATGAADAVEAARAGARSALAAMRTPGPWIERLAREAGLEVTASTRAATGAAEVLPGAPALSDREQQVLRLLRGDLSLREIADELYVSHNTIKTHTRNVYRKLGVSQRSELRELRGA
jgi:LuxR family maltose regulon positive regulatory protein